MIRQRFLSSQLGWGSVPLSLTFHDEIGYDEIHHFKQSDDSASEE